MAGEYADFEKILCDKTGDLIKYMLDDASWHQLAGPVYDSFIKEAMTIAGEKSTICMSGDNDECEIRAQAYVFVSSDETIESGQISVADLIQSGIDDGYIGPKAVVKLMDRLRRMKYDR